MSSDHGVKLLSASTNGDGNDPTGWASSQRADEGLLEEMRRKKVDGLDLTYAL